VEAWIGANAHAVSEALRAAEDELYGLLGGERDRDREREALATEVARLRLTWKPKGLALAVAAPASDVGRDRDAGLQARVWNWRARLNRERQNPGPVRQVIVFLFILGIARPDLGGHLFERQGQHGCRGKLTATTRTDISGAARHEVLNQCTERRVLLLGIVDCRRRVKTDHLAAVEF
jgi:hypothetical protein